MKKPQVTPTKWARAKGPSLLNVSESEFLSEMENCLQSGITKEQTFGKLEEYIVHEQKIAVRKEVFNPQVYIYKDLAWLFHESHDALVLITVKQLPKSAIKDLEKIKEAN